MATAMRTATTVAAAGPRGLRSLFSTLSTNFPFPSPSANQPQRPQAEPSTNLFVSGLSKRTTDEGLRECFAKFGEVVHARVVKDRASGWSKGFGFVRYTTLEGAAAGIEGMDGKFLDGWVIFAEYARPRDAAPPPPPPSYGNNQYGQQ
ncbi:hypothetical protein L6452_28674 [Arctium lappa]|uniref:Uncharacterized protein n=1 Tax=Arctium lappa TaxID=4217 RepID=A0ACB8ZZ43_ARCLA|nr:hypothetical protein L6452_28674 [Arctium lappa]